MNRISFENGFPFIRFFKRFLVHEKFDGKMDLPTFYVDNYFQCTI